jgi:4-diphosphocytidyl-2-C-methyl-D-erythritol kinase
LTPIDSEIAYAKINLALHVRAREPDGYHQIETLFAFAEDGDLLTAEPAEGLTLAIEGPFGAGLADQPDNLVMQAARALREAFGVEGGAAIRLDKRLPIASGIGGGSADAAAALRLLARLWALPEGDDRIGAIARKLGADVPACLLSRPVRGEGRGDALTRIDEGTLGGMPLLLVHPGVPVPTGPVFAAWDGVDRGRLDDGDPLAVARGARNDLEVPARGIAREIGAVLALLDQAEGVVLARMSGSGATCFALFETLAARDAADATIARERPGWWRLKTGLRRQRAVL